MRTTLRKALSVILATAAVSAGCSSSSAAPDWKLVWSDEFDGTTLDPTKWKVDTGMNFGTGQQDYDTARPENISVSNGVLKLTARSESYNGAQYTSGRIETGGIFSQAYGKFEARIQIPDGQGLWPAFWMLGDNYTTTGWPTCGEIDIMEERGVNPAVILGSMHGPGGDNYSMASTSDASGGFSGTFHTYTLEWQTGQLQWFVDGTLYETQTADTLPTTQTWVFDHPFFVLLDLAVGGDFGGPIGSSTALPQSLIIDYVRVYVDASKNDASAG